MGKASRQKGQDRDTVDHARPGRRFLEKAGLCRIPPSPRLWDFLEATLPRDYVQRLSKAMVARGGGDHSFDPYALLWENLDTAKATYGWLAPISEPWLAWVEQHGSFGPRVLDLGCGMGVHTCYYAWRHPESEVVGVDRSTEGIARAGELAATLALENVRFLQADATNLDAAALGGAFHTITASTFLADARPGMLFATGADPWSTTRSVERALSDSRFDHVDRMVGLLADGGEYLGLERASDAVDLAVWLGALCNGGLAIDQATLGVLQILMAGDVERIPAVRAHRAATTDLTVLVDLVRTAKPNDFAAEDALECDPPQERLWGREFHVQDQMGSGMTRVQVLRLKSGLVVYYEATSRGHRDLWVADPPEEAFEEAENFLSMAENSPTVLKIMDIAMGV